MRLSESFKVHSPDSTHELVMITPYWYYQHGAGSKWQNYPATGVYKVGSETPLYSFDWYSRDVYLSEGGKYVVNWNYPSALAFYDSGNLVKNYSVPDLVRAPFLLPEWLWQREGVWFRNLDVHVDTLTLSTYGDEQYVIDIATGEILSSVLGMDPRKPMFERVYRRMVIQGALSIAILVIAIFFTVSCPGRLRRFFRHVWIERHVAFKVALCVAILHFIHLFVWQEYLSTAPRAESGYIGDYYSFLFKPMKTYTEFYRFRSDHNWVAPLLFTFPFFLIVFAVLSLHRLILAFGCMVNWKRNWLVVSLILFCLGIFAISSDSIMPTIYGFFYRITTGYVPLDWGKI